ncbi:hypothetical protein BKA56DRAFT_503555 [Ilyonectria sp. MPI-CAGE-AT-0026]|nr:hypothetical protein BKA56DRAFT_503555 [Ilyonectria sp. MPI-CAGE-AT-0026]
MDAFGSVGTSTSLVVQSFHLFRHISSARRFADNAGNLSGLIAIEYFRFETWLQQSGLLVVEPGSGTLVVTESSLRRAILLAADAQFMEYHRVENHVLTTLNQVYQCLLAIKKLRDKYSLKQADSGDNIRTSDLTDSTNLGLEVTTEIPGSVPLFHNTRVATAIVTDTNLRERRAKTMSFFRKVSFSWSLKDDSSDHNKITVHIQTLNSCNNTLRECLPPQQQHAADRLINVKALSLSDSPPELQGIGTAASTVHNNPLHDQIYQAMTVKAKRVGESSLGISPQDLQQGMLDSTTLTFNRDDTVVTTGISDRIMAQHKQSESQPPKTVILEWVIFHPSLPESDLDLLHERIALLCALLRSAGHPYFPALPLCSGFFRQGRTSFALVYQLPPFAAPSQPPRSLYSLLPRNKYSVVTEKRSTVILPSLEQRYELAAALADAVLSLLSVDWMHKTITSRNVVLYHQSSAAGGSQFQNRIGFSHPQLLGFGLARRERPAERTIDLRDGGLSPWRFWQHPELVGFPLSNAPPLEHLNNTNTH